MNSSYVVALETKARWKKQVIDGIVLDPLKERMHAGIALSTSDTHFMNEKFCDLVSHACQNVPNEMKFDQSWTHDHYGWMWLEKPLFFKNAGETQFLSPPISAVGWLPLTGPPGIRSEKLGFKFFLFSQTDDGFETSAYCEISDGDQMSMHDSNLLELIGPHSLHRPDKQVCTCKISEVIRWIYAAFHLMAQKLAVQIPIQPDRASRKRAEREGREPEQIKVISLRRLEEARNRNHQAVENSESPEWNWQWTVRGHWRNQWYRAAQEHRSIFVEAYIKGPEDKPLKEPGQKLFVAVR